MTKEKKKEKEEVVRFDSVEFRASIPRELYQRALEIGGALGLNKTQIIISALESWVTDSGRREMYRDFLALRADEHDTSTSEVNSQILEAYEKVGRAKKQNLESKE